MALLLGIDVGTTTITSLALDPSQGELRAVATLANEARVTSASDAARGRSEWDAARIWSLAVQALRGVVEQLGPRSKDVIAVGVTGQQHGVVILDRRGEPLMPFINWQDRRGEDETSPGGPSWTQVARSRLGEDTFQRTGCRLATGYMGTTLFWLKAHDLLPATGRACFVMDFVASRLADCEPRTEPTSGGSSGVFDAVRRDWDLDALAALELPRQLFVDVQEATTPLGRVAPAVAGTTGLAAGLPVAVAIGDNQASFIGSVADRQDSVLVNVGTGGQVTCFTDRYSYAPPLEARPFPFAGNLLVNAGLCGGQSYAVVERFFRLAGEMVLGHAVENGLYERLNAMAASAPPGAGGLRCEPFFTGTRADPARRAQWTGVSPENFKPGHVVRALLEGMARTFRDGYAAIERVTSRPRHQLIGAGNGLRKNAVLAGCVADEFGMALRFPKLREEAAVGAALLAGVTTGVFADLSAAGATLQYD